MHSPESLLRQLEDYRSQNPVGVVPAGLYDPAEYIMSLGGKRMRPLLLLLSYGLFRDDFERAMPAALGVEVLHNFTLVHDDIMDNANVRRGHPAVHKKYGTDTAILSGDVMMIRSFDLILHSCSDENAASVLQLALDTSREICEGQQMDMEFEEREEVSVSEYLEMIRLKTAVLLSACLQTGAMLAGAENAVSYELYQAGLLFGKAFQIQDDLLDAFGKTEKTGKKRGGDIVNSKKTFLYTMVLERLPVLRREAFIEMYNQSASNPEVKIQKVLRVFEEFNIAGDTRAEVERVYHAGVAKVESIGVDGVRMLPLLDLAGKLKGRNL